MDSAILSWNQAKQNPKLFFQQSIELHGSFYQEILSKACDLLANEKIENVMVLGAGHGAIAPHVFQYFPLIQRLILIDKESTAGELWESFRTHFLTREEQSKIEFLAFDLTENWPAITVKGKTLVIDDHLLHCLEISQQKELLNTLARKSPGGGFLLGEALTSDAVKDDLVEGPYVVKGNRLFHNGEFYRSILHSYERERFFVESSYDLRYFYYRSDRNLQIGPQTWISVVQYLASIS